MKRSRLKNIISKSKETKPIVGEPFDEFKKSLPEGIVPEGYRLEEAWKAYGQPDSFNGAIWEGLIQPIDKDTYKFPSIGYNTETDEYEYLNTGKTNELVDKDIRVWDNDVIPLVKELKLGGYVRTFNEEKNCWTYSKNLQKREQSTESNEQQVNSFQKGGKSKTKPKYEDQYKTVPKEKNNTDNYDLERAYNELSFEELENFRTNPEAHLSGDYKKPNHPTYDENQDSEYKGRYGWFKSGYDNWEFYPSPRQLNIHDVDWYKKYWDQNEPESTLVIGEYGKPPVWMYTRVPLEERLRKFRERIQNTQLGVEYPSSLSVYKQGGQMSVIPEGALHARKNNMELAKEGEVTHKGIPVVDNDGEQQAEIERNEIIFSKNITDKIEELYKKYNEEESSSKKDDIAIKMGKIITCEITKNTQDNTGLIQQITQENVQT